MGDVTERLSELVKNAMKDNLQGSGSNWPFLSPEDYTKKTGKRFRMTKAQKEAGISREQAFQEFMESLINK
jgi:hypothetical protein